MEEVKGFEGSEEYKEEKFEEGFNLKTLAAALFIGFVMLPGAIYLGLITGASIGGAAQWVTIILFVEIAKRSLVQLKKQEIYIIYIIASSLVAPGLIMGAASLVLQGGAFAEKIWQQYLVQSPYAKAFGLSDKIPSWVVPPAGSEALIKRTFINKAWVIPIILLVGHNVLFRLNYFGLGYLFYKITADIERLPFPMAPVAAEGATALAESSAKKEAWRWRVFSISAMIGIIFGLFYVVIPTFTGLIVAKPFMLFPIPWVDATDEIGSRFPSAMFGWATDLAWVFAGFVLPFWVVIGTFVGSFLAYTILNPIFCRIGIIENWRPGMTVIPTGVATTMDIWLSVTIGMGIVVALVGMWKVTMTFIRPVEKREIRKPPPERGDFPVWLALLVWIFSTTAYIYICHILVPRFPLWIFIIFGFLFTPLLSFVSARMFGITGVAGGISFPMVREGTFILSGYKGVDIWFAPVPYFNHGYFTQRFQELNLTRTRFPSWVKAEFTALVIMLICSFLFWQIIWRMGPIPSSTYPFVQKMWPMSAIYKSLWATATLEGGAKWMLKAIKPLYIGLSSGVGILIYLLLVIFKAPVSFFYGIVGGVAMFPHYTFPMFVGALLGKYFFARRIGADTWKRYTPIILAGYSCGMGLVGMASVALALIAKTVTSLIF